MSPLQRRLTDFEWNRGIRGRNALACKGCRDGRIATAEMLAQYNKYMQGMLPLIRRPSDCARPSCSSTFFRRIPGLLATCSTSWLTTGVVTDFIMGGGPTCWSSERRAEFHAQRYCPRQSRPASHAGQLDGYGSCVGYGVDAQRPALSEFVRGSPAGHYQLPFALSLQANNPMAASRRNSRRSCCAQYRRTTTMSSPGYRVIFIEEAAGALLE